MMILALLLTFAGIAFYEVPGLIRQKRWRELSAFAVLLTVGFVLSLLQTIGVKVPNPTKGIESIIKYLSGLVT